MWAFDNSPWKAIQMKPIHKKLSSSSSSLLSLSLSLSLHVPPPLLNQYISLRWWWWWWSWSGWHAQGQGRDVQAQGHAGGFLLRRFLILLLSLLPCYSKLLSLFLFLSPLSSLLSSLLFSPLWLYFKGRRSCDCRNLRCVKCVILCVFTKKNLFAALRGMWRQRRSESASLPFVQGTRH